MEVFEATSDPEATAREGYGAEDWLAIGGRRPGDLLRELGKVLAERTQSQGRVEEVSCHAAPVALAAGGWRRPPYQRLWPVPASPLAPGARRT